MDDPTDPLTCQQHDLVYARHAFRGLCQTFEIERQHAARQRSEHRAEGAALRGQIATAQAELDQARQMLQIYRIVFAAVLRGHRRPLMRLRTWLRAASGRDAATVRASHYFDAAWYRERYPDVAQSGLDPARHYARTGYYEGRDPGPKFSTSGYYGANPDVAAIGANPLLHYEHHGRAEQRKLRAPEVPSTHPSERCDIAFVSGEPGTPGHIYRIRRPAEAAQAVGLQSRAVSLNDAAGDPALLDARVVIIWRAEWSERVAAVIAAARGFGARIVFDCDDLMVEPELARFEFIDGIRTQSLTEQIVSDFYGRVQQTLLAADACLSPTRFLTARMQRFGKPGYVLPNGFDDRTMLVSAAAARARQAAGPTPLLRLGYAGGTRTHQKDFAVIAAPVAAILRQAGNRRLVLFRNETQPCLDIDEFAELAPLSAQIEWRDMVGLEELPWELARFDINLAPLEVGNPYCEAKSELKFFEAALVGVPTIASPTQPFRDAIRDGETGFLAVDATTWFDRMAALLNDEALRTGMAQAAFANVAERYGAAQRGAVLTDLVQTATQQPH